MMIVQQVLIYDEGGSASMIRTLDRVSLNVVIEMACVVSNCCTNGQIHKNNMSHCHIFDYLR